MLVLKVGVYSLVRAQQSFKSLVQIHEKNGKSVKISQMSDCQIMFTVLYVISRNLAKKLFGALVLQRSQFQIPSFTITLFTFPYLSLSFREITIKTQGQQLVCKIDFRVELKPTLLVGANH